MWSTETHCRLLGTLYTHALNMSEKLSQKSLELLTQLFSEKSNLQLPVGVARQAVEIHTWASAQLLELQGKEAPESAPTNPEQE